MNYYEKNDRIKLFKESIQNELRWEKNMEAMLYEKLSDNRVKCLVCNHYCILKDGQRGICGVRENKKGIMEVLNYGKTIANSVDPIEKKPLNHFLQGTITYSFAAVGCNMKCPWCQNYSISQSPKPNKNVIGTFISPKEHIVRAIHYQCPSISYTYSEPTIFLEYAFEVMVLAKIENLKNIWVTNGYMSKETLELILPLLDAANVDYKGKNDIYKNYCSGNGIDILENMKMMKEANVHLEVTSLIIPGLNDSYEDLHDIVNDLVKYLGKDTPWHISRFFPAYKMKNIPITPIETLEMAKEIGHKAGLKKIYLGNV